ncbi:beta strand repeat-containing protein [Agrobacterium cavarae]|uniref:beta strand repeat-containing protein n=1 Tax=Agrobacterium cavarae TaxID=2528239 RepID=UPI003EE52A99
MANSSNKPEKNPLSGLKDPTLDGAILTFSTSVGDLANAARGVFDNATPTETLLGEAEAVSRAMVGVGAIATTVYTVENDVNSHDPSHRSGSYVALDLMNQWAGIAAGYVAGGLTTTILSETGPVALAGGYVVGTGVGYTVPLALGAIENAFSLPMLGPIDNGPTAFLSTMDTATAVEYAHENGNPYPGYTDYPIDMINGGPYTGVSSDADQDPNNYGSPTDDYADANSASNGWAVPDVPDNNPDLPGASYFDLDLATQPDTDVDDYSASPDDGSLDAGDSDYGDGDYSGYGSLSSGDDDSGGDGSTGGGDGSGDSSGGNDGSGSNDDGSGGSDSSGDDGGDDSGDGGDDGDSGDGGGDDGSPVILDLTGKGINIAPRGASDVFFDMAGDGKQHRTAWAGAGNGVLVLDLDGSGKITQEEQVQFTAWDPTASSDMDALKDVFDTNHNGKLDPGDANWANFKVMVTNADGSMTLKTLSDLGITSINLISNHQSIVMPDGSGIRGETTFTRSDGTTGTAADAVLAYDADGYVVNQTITHNSDGTTTIDSKSSDANGNLAKEVISTYSANGTSITRKFDDNGDGVFGRTQTETIVTNSDGSITETIRNYNDNGSNLTSVVQTTTASNGKLKTVAQDTLGAGHFDELETISIGADGSQTTTASDLNPDGSAHDKVMTTASADGLTKTVISQQTGSGQTNSTQSDLITVATNGTRTETVTNYAGSGTGTASIVSQTTTVSSSDGSSKTAKSDLDGNGSIDLTTTSSIVVNSDHSTTTTQTDTNSDSSLRDEVVTTLSANGLTTTTKSDSDGDGAFETVTTKTLAHNSDGSGSVTKITNNANGTERNETLSSWSADGKTRTSQVDADGDGHFDQVDSSVVGSDGSLTETTSNYTPNGATLISKQVAKTSADAKTKTVQIDLNADGTFDTEQQTTKVTNSDGSATVTTIFSNGDGSVPTKKTSTTSSANGLSTTIQTFLDGAASPYEQSTNVTVVNSDGSTTRTVTYLQGTAQTQIGKSVTTTSADKSTTTVSNYVDTNTAPATVTATVLHSDGSTTQTVSNYSPDGSKLLSTSATTASADGLNVASTIDKNGDGVVDATSVSSTVLESDGTTQVTTTNYAGSSTAAAHEVSQTVTNTSTNGLSVTTQTNGMGTGPFTSKSTDVTVLNSNGSKTETRSNYNGAGTTLLDRTTVTTSATGLSTTTSTDANGDGVNDSVIIDTVVLNADGSTTETQTVADSAGDIIRKTVSTRNSSKGTAVSTYLDGSTKTHETKATTVNSDGSVTTTDTTYDAGGNVTSTATATTNANGLTQSTSETNNVGSLAGQSTSSVTVLNVDGSRTQTFSDLDGAGHLLDKSVKTTSADALSSTTKWDDNGDGTFDYSMSSAATINSDGSKTSTTSSYNADGSLHNRTIITTSADGNTTTTTRDLNGDGVVDQTIQSSLNSDGSSSASLMDGTVKSASGRAYGATDGKYQKVSANGLTTTTFYDADGNGLAEKERIAATVLGTDGSRTTTITNEALSGGTASSASPGYTAVVTDRTVDQISANGLSETTKWDISGSGTYSVSRSKTTVLNSDGSATQTVAFYNNGTLTSQEATTTSGNGLSTTTTWDPTGSGQTIQQTSSVKALNTDGSTVVTINNSSLNGFELSKSTTTTSADGLTTVTRIDENGDGDIDKIRTRTVQRLADGSVLTNVTDTDDNNSTIDVISTEVSADGRRSWSQIDADGDGNKDQITATIVSVDGSARTTVTNYNSDGSIDSKVVSSTTADGLTTTTQQDLNGNGVFDRQVVDVTNNNADGSTVLTEKTFAISQFDSNGTEVAMTPALMRSVTRKTSADGRTTITTTDVDGNGSVDRTETTVLRADGSQTTTTTSNSAAEKYQSRLGKVFWQSSVGVSGQLFAAQSVTTVRADGMSWTVQSDYDGNGTYEHTENWTRNIDGSQVAAISDVNASGAVIARGIETVSADGLSTILDEDKTNSGRINHIVRATTRPDGSELEFVTDINSDGTLANATTTVVDADGQTSWTGQTFGAAITKTITESNGQQSFSGTVATLSVSGKSEAIVLGYAVDKVTLTGSSDRVYMIGSSSVTISANGSNETLDVGGRDNIANVSNVTVTIDNGGALILSGSKDTVTMNNDASLTLWAGTGDTVEVAGNGDEVQGSSLHVAVDDNHDVVLRGNNDSVVAHLNSRVVDTDTSTTGNTLEVAATGVNATINGWSVSMDANTSLTLTGNGNSVAVHSSDNVTVTSGTGDVLDILGTNVTANVSNATATIESGATATLNGTNLAVTEQANATVSVTGTQDSITILGSGGTKTTASGATITLSGSGTDTLTGSRDTVNMGSNTSLQISGANDNLVFHSGFGTETVSGYQASGSTADKIAFDKTSFSGWSDLLSNSQASGSDVIITTHSNDTLTLKNTSLSNLQQSNFSFA